MKSTTPAIIISLASSVDRREKIGTQSTLVLSTDSDLFKFLKSSDAEPPSGE
jgi:hypothetical protein